MSLPVKKACHHKGWVEDTCAHCLKAEIAMFRYQLAFSQDDVNSLARELATMCRTTVKQKDGESRVCAILRMVGEALIKRGED